MITALKVVFSALFLWMCYVVVSTCLQSNLFTEWDFLGSIPWMRATLWDFYANIFIIYLFICYRERRVLPIILWLVLLFTLGSIASCGYVLIQLFSLKKGEGIKELLSPKYER